MAKYLLTYHGGGMPESEAEQQAVMTGWIEWFGSLGDAVVDMGNPVGASATVAPDGSVSDGGGANPATGYSIVSAGDLTAATVIAKGCPVLTGGGTVEVSETIEVS
jgi:hypothetical protein